MKNLKRFWGENWQPLSLILLALAGTAGLLLYRLGNLTGGLSGQEMTAATAPVGWHGIWHDPLNLPLKLLRSLVFWLRPDHGQILTRLPNAFFGGLAAATFSWLVWLWHGSRTAVMTTLLFATSAWTLHVSRLASFDVLYLWAVPTLLIIQAILHRQGHKPYVWYGTLILWGLMLYIPGMVWLVLLQIYLQRGLLRKNWGEFLGWKSRIYSLAAFIVWLPLLIIDLTRHGELIRWIGAPQQLAAPLELLKQFGSVFVHLFVHGAKQPDLWLGKAPILDVLTLLAALLGGYFYVKKWKAARSRLLGAIFVVGVLLVTLGGPVSLSILVPVLYAWAAAGLAYLLHEWLKVFPLNPLARGLGIVLISAAVALSCFYNLRAYFVAWPHNSATKQTFIYYRP